VGGARCKKKKKLKGAKGKKIPRVWIGGMGKKEQTFWGEEMAKRSAQPV